MASPFLHLKTYCLTNIKRMLYQDKHYTPHADDDSVYTLPIL